MNGTRSTPTSKKIIKSLINRFGEEAYDALDIPHPESDPRAFLLSIGIPSKFVDKVLIARSEYSAELSKRGISQDSLEGQLIIKEAFSRHGVHFTDTE